MVQKIGLYCIKNGGAKRYVFLLPTNSQAYPFVEKLRSGSVGL